MRYLMALWLAVIGACGSAHAANVSLDDFLLGVDEQCRYSDALDRFVGSLLDERVRDPREQLPAPLRAAAGPLAIEEEDDFTMVTVPIAGQWHGVPVRELRFALGRDNGIHVLIVQFAAPVARVKQVFESRVAAASAALAADAENASGITIELSVENGTARLICDLST